MIIFGEFCKGPDVTVLVSDGVLWPRVDQYNVGKTNIRNYHEQINSSFGCGRYEFERIRTLLFLIFLFVFFPKFFVLNLILFIGRTIIGKVFLSALILPTLWTDFRLIKGGGAKGCNDTGGTVLGGSFKVLDES